MTNRSRSIFAIAALLLAALGGGARAEAPAAAPKGSEYSEWVPPAMRDIGIDERSGETLPLDLKFYDETGKLVELKQFFDGTRPVVLQLGYFNCPQLCGQITQGMVESLKSLTLNMGSEYRLLYVSFDPTETAPLALQKRQNLLREYGRENATLGMHLLTGDKAQIQRLTQAVGYHYKWDDTLRQFSHPAVVMILTPDGKISRYLYGIKQDPQTFRLSLVESAEGKIGTTTDRIMLICFMYDGTTGRYGPRVAMMVMQVGGAVTLVTIASLLGFLYVREHRRRVANPNAQALSPVAGEASTEVKPG